MAEPSAHQSATTDAYDAVAELYAEMARHHLDDQPLDRAVLAAFAELVRTTGVVSWYSVIHVPPPEMPRYLAEFSRVLADGGHLLLGFFESEGGPVTSFDHRVATAYRWPVDDLARLTAEAGFHEVGRMLREPLEGERFRRGNLLLRRGSGEEPRPG